MYCYGQVVTIVYTYLIDFQGQVVTIVYTYLIDFHCLTRGIHGCDGMVVGFTTTSAISTYHH